MFLKYFFIALLYIALCSNTRDTTCQRMGPVRLRIVAAQLETVYPPCTLLFTNNRSVTDICDPPANKCPTSC